MFLGLNRLRTRAALVEENGLSEEMAEAVFKRVEPVQHSEDGTPLYLKGIVVRVMEQVWLENNRLSSPANAFVSEQQNPNTRKGGAGQPLMKTNEAARYLAISERQVQYEVQKGNIAVIQFGKACIRFAKEDLDAFVQRFRKSARHEGGQGWQA